MRNKQFDFHVTVLEISSGHSCLNCTGNMGFSLAAHGFILNNNNSFLYPAAPDPGVQDKHMGNS